MDNPHKKLELGCSNDSKRNEILETLLRKIAYLEDENATLRRDLVKTAGTCDEYTADADRDAATITYLQYEIMTLLGRMTLGRSQQPVHEHDMVPDSTPFVVVLIDGRQFMLQDEHVRRGSEGGRQAARRFHRSLMRYLIQRDVFQSHWRLVIKFHASACDLGTAYLKSKVINSLATWRDFVTGFNEESSLCHFVDTGGPIQRHAELLLSHQNCQHTVLVALPPDGIHANLLRQSIKPDHPRDKIMLLEPTSFPDDFKELSAISLPSHTDSLFPFPLPLTLKCEPPSPIPKAAAAVVARVKPPQMRHASCPEPHVSTTTAATSTTSTTASNAAPLSPPPPAKTRPPSPSLTSTSPRKPLSHTQARAPAPAPAIRRPRARRTTFFDARGRRVDSRVYADLYTARYLLC